MKYTSVDPSNRFPDAITTGRSATPDAFRADPRELRCPSGDTSLTGLER